MKYLIWALLWPVLFAIGLIGRILSPLVCLFIVTKPRTDSVKRLIDKLSCCHATA